MTKVFYAKLDNCLAGVALSYTPFSFLVIVYSEHTRKEEIYE